jgi:hypothetical protein
LSTTFQGAFLREKLPEKAEKVILVLFPISLLLSDIVSTLSFKPCCLNNLQEDVFEQDKV